MDAENTTDSDRADRLQNDAFVIDSHNDTIVAHIRRGFLSLFDDVEGEGSNFDAGRAIYRLHSGIDHVGIIGLTRGTGLPRDDEAIVQIDFPKMIRGGIDLAFFAIDVTLALGVHLPYAIDGFGWFLDEMETHSGKARLVRCRDDIDRAIEAGVPAALLAIEHADATEGSIHVLRGLYEMGVRSIGLTHNRSSRAADGCGEARDGVGLTVFGELLIREMNRLGMIVDLAHASPSAFYHALELSESPVFFSHGNAKALCDHQRNLDDRQIEALAKNGGVIGMSFVPRFIDSENPTIDRLLDHIDHVRSVGGIDVIGIGSDFDGGGTLVRDASHYKTITSGLIDRGYTDVEIRQVLGGNTLRVLEAVL